MAWKGIVSHSAIPFLTFYFSYPYSFLKEKGQIS